MDKFYSFMGKYGWLVLTIVGIAHLIVCAVSSYKMYSFYKSLN